MSNNALKYEGKTYRLVEGVHESSCEGCSFNIVGKTCGTPREILGDCGLEIYEEVHETAFAEAAEPFVGASTEGERVLNASGGVKNDGGKVRPTLLIKSMPRAVKELLDVLENGAQKYGPDNWKLVENERYDDAALRHLIFGYFAGETYDKDSGKHHLAHAVANLLFLLEKELSE